MKIILDNCTPAPLGRHLVGHVVHHCAEVGWERLENGRLLAEAEEKYDLFITCDLNLRYQQNMTGRKIAILELRVQHWPKLRQLVDQVAKAVDAMQPGEYRILFQS